MTYVTAGDPTFHDEGILRAPIGQARMSEVGVPFSDPLADGPVIQRATERALASGTTLSGVLQMVMRLRTDLRAPIVIFSYANPILRLGAEQFADEAKAAGVDGVLVLDLPIEEAAEFRALLGARGIDTILLPQPDDERRRLRRAAASAAGFCSYFAARCHRARDAIADGAEEIVRRIRTVSPCPSPSVLASRSPNTCGKRAVGRRRRGGSALVSVIAEAGGRPISIPVEEYVAGWLQS